MPDASQHGRKAPAGNQRARWSPRAIPAVAARRGVRAGVVIPAVFAIGEQLLHSSNVALFAAFGSVTMLLFVEFGGPMRQRLVTHAAFAVATMVPVILGTACSRTAWVAAVVALVFSFLVLFSAVISSVLAAATSGMLISFLLPVTIPGPLSVVPGRLAGWLLAGGATLAAVAFIWPSPTGDPLTSAAGAACRALAARISGESQVLAPQAEVGPVQDPGSPLEVLRQTFFRAPYRPAGLGTAARMLIQAVQQILLLEAILDRRPAHTRPPDTSVAALFTAASTLLSDSGSLLAAGHADPSQLEAGIRRVREASNTLKSDSIDRLSSNAPRALAEDLLSVDASLEAAFHAHEVAAVVVTIACYAQLTAAARGRGWIAQLIGRVPALPDTAPVVDSPAVTAWERAAAHLDWQSVWLHNSIRGAAGFGLAVLAADGLGVQHAFWVAFGTLAVLRSNASNTGQNALRAMLGTVAGIIAGGVLVEIVGRHTTACWILLPFAVAFAGIAPVAFSFAAGQAGFTFVLILLFNIIGPTGWSIGAVRVEDMALGCGIGVAASFLLWPRGAGAALSKEISAALLETIRYLAEATQFALTRCDATCKAEAESPDTQRREAVNAARRLDDGFRQFLAERGTKHISLADIATLITAVAVLRRTADSICALWADDTPASGDRTAARVEILQASQTTTTWFDGVAVALLESGIVPSPLAPDPGAAQRLIIAVRRDLLDGDGSANAIAVKMIWTLDHLQALQQTQGDLLQAVRLAVAANRMPLAWLYAGHHRSTRSYGLAHQAGRSLSTTSQQTI
jgi:fusaric acid resistance family protein